MMKTTPDRRRPPEEVLAFMPGDDEFGIDMQKVQEICGFDAFSQDARPVDLDNGQHRIILIAMDKLMTASAAMA